MKFPYLMMRLLIVICVCTGLYALYQIYNKNDSSLDSIKVYQEHTHKSPIKEANHLIISSDSDLEGILAHIPEMDWIITGKEQYSIPEYFKTLYTNQTLMDTYK